MLAPNLIPNIHTDTQSSSFLVCPLKLPSHRLWSTVTPCHKVPSCALLWCHAETPGSSRRAYVPVALSPAPLAPCRGDWQELALAWLWHWPLFVLYMGILICQRFGAKVASRCKCLFANICVKCHLPDDHSIRKESNRKPDMQQHVWIAQLCGILDWNTGGSEHTPDPPDCKQDITGPCSWSCDWLSCFQEKKKNRSPQYLDGAFKNMNTNYNSTPLALYLHVMSHRKQSQLHRSAKGELKTNTVQRTVWRKTNYDEEGAARLSGCSIPWLLFIHCCESDSSSTYSAYLVSIYGWYHTFSAAFAVNI